jgi:O-antigen/teichoic acid export membrane protein
LLSFDPWVETVLAAVPGGRRLLALKDRLASFADQGFQGVGNIIAMALFAHTLPRGDFGALGVAIGLYYFVFGLHRSAVVLQFIVSTARPGAFEAKDRRAWFWLNALLVLALCGGLSLLAIGALALRGPVAQEPLFVKALQAALVMTPCLLMAEFSRRLLYQAHLPASAALAGVLQFGVMLGVAIAANRLGGGLTWAALAWSAGGLASLAVSLLVMPPGAPGGLRHGLARWLENPGNVLWQCLNTIPYSIANSSLTVIVGAFGGGVAAATFNVAKTLANPATAMVSAVDSLDKPRAARALAQGGLPALRDSIGRTRRLLVLLTGGYLLVVMLLAHLVVPLAFGPAYQGAELSVRVLAVGFFLMCLNQPSETLLIVLGAGRLMFLTRLVAAIATVAGLALAARHGVLGAAAAVTVAQLINLAGLMMAESKALADARTWAVRGPDPAPDDESLVESGQVGS